MAAWPASLPQTPLLQGFSEGMPDTTLRTQMDAGPGKTRKRFSAGIKLFQFELILTADQAATFDTFFRTDTADGALPFDWKNPRTDVAVSFRMVTPPPPALVSIDKDIYRLALSLEQLP